MGQVLIETRFLINTPFILEIWLVLFIDQLSLKWYCNYATLERVDIVKESAVTLWRRVEDVKSSEVHVDGF